MIWWNRKKVIKEVIRLKDVWQMSKGQDVVDFIMKHPKLVNKEMYEMLCYQDWPEIRKGYV